MSTVRYLGVDPGGRRIGLAVGDTETGIVSPLQVLPYNGVAAAAALIEQQASKLGAACVVLGRPARADGSPTPACRRSEKLAAALRERELEVVMQNELLTTNEARRRARETGLRRNAPIDHIAAQVLLEEYLASRLSP